MFTKVKNKPLEKKKYSENQRELKKLKCESLAKDNLWKRLHLLKTESHLGASKFLRHVVVT